MMLEASTAVLVAFDVTQKLQASSLQLLLPYLRLLRDVTQKPQEGQQKLLFESLK